MHRNLHTRSHIFLKISIFCKNIITFSSSAHLMKKSTFLPKFHFFFFAQNWHFSQNFIFFFAQNWHFSQNFIFFFFAQNWHFCTKIDVDRIICYFSSKFARHYSITVLRKSHICPKFDVFCIECDFLLKENNATKNWHFSETVDTSLKKINISIKN